MLEVIDPLCSAYSTCSCRSAFQSWCHILGRRSQSKVRRRGRWGFRNHIIWGTDGEMFRCFEWRGGVEEATNTCLCFSGGRTRTSEWVLQELPLELTWQISPDLELWIHVKKWAPRTDRPSVRTSEIVSQFGWELEKGALSDWGACDSIILSAPIPAPRYTGPCSSDLLWSKTRMFSAGFYCITWM